jgi:fructose-1,6-bisphosphatase/inositol monophosphatase family enzyme
VLLIQEGGGRCVNLDNQSFTFNQPYPKVNGIIATNGHIHEEVLQTLAPHRTTARTT